MPTIITRIFRTATEAEAAAEALREESYDPATIAVTEAAPTSAETEAALVRAGLTGPAAKDYANWVQQGGTAVTIRAPFSQAASAMRILKRAGGIATGLPDRHETSVDTLSAMLCLPLLSHNPAPLSSSLGMTSLGQRQTPKARLIDNPALLSNVLSIPSLGGGPTPLSSIFGLRALSRGAAPLSGLFGLPVLINSSRRA